MQGSGVQGSGVQGSGVQGSGVQGLGIQGAGVQGSGEKESGVQGSGVQVSGEQGSTVFFHYIFRATEIFLRSIKMQRFCSTPIKRGDCANTHKALNSCVSVHLCCACMCLSVHVYACVCVCIRVVHRFVCVHKKEIVPSKQEEANAPPSQKGNSTK